MSRYYTFSVIGMYNYDHSIFDNLKLPEKFFTEGYADLFHAFVAPDKDLLIKHILMECGQLSLLHTDVDFFKKEIEIWSQVHEIDWCQMYETIYYKYNPIWNKDGVYTETENITGEGNTSNTRTLTGNDSDTFGGSDTEHGTNSDDSTTTNYVNAFDSGEVMHDKSVYSGEGTDSKVTTYGKTRQGTRGESITESGSNADNSTRTNTRKEQGNIGVTMTQEMIARQRDIIMNFYDYIVGQFKERFCILIW